LLLFFQSAAVRDKLKEPHVSQLDGNVYVRRAGAVAKPLIVWGPVETSAVENEQNTVDIFALEDLRKMQPQFETKSQAFPDHRGPLFRGRELERFELLRAFAGSGAGLPLAPTVRELLRLPQNTGTFPGAYAPQP
jgi:hypothetical protein